MDIKRADFAGSWYPGTSFECERDIRAFLSDPVFRDVPGDTFQAGIVPHAGWYFSGALACRVISHLVRGPKPDVIVLFGRHMRSGDRAVLLACDGFETPLGVIGIRKDLAFALSHALDLREERGPNAVPENTIELQLPFIRHFFPETPVVAIGVPPNEDAIRIGRKTVETAKDMGLSARIIGSTDLTHYGPNYGFSPMGGGNDAVRWVKDVNDRRMIDLMLALDAKSVIAEARSSSNACCGGAVAATLSAAHTLGSEKGELVGYTTSYDKSPGHSLVGYGGVVF